MAETYTHPDTGDTVEIPDGAEVVRNADLPNKERNPGFVDENGVEHEYGDDAVHYWRNPPALKEGETSPEFVEDYEPRFKRDSITRRVLQQITDEVDQSWLGPRNNTQAIAFALLRDDETKDIRPEGGLANAEQATAAELERLLAAGLVERDDDDRYHVTEAGHTELVN